MRECKRREMAGCGYPLNIGVVFNVCALDNNGGNHVEEDE